MSTEQFRMRRLQVFNWGTFSGIHDIPIAKQGFLFVGRSGSGKSTLLDAFSALMIPPRWVDFNAAAREADRGSKDRNQVTYIRGAWAEQKDGDSGEIATRYLRTGSTWSALALTYENQSGSTVVLAQVFWLRGNSNNNADVRRCYLILEKPFDLIQLLEFGNSNFEPRVLKQMFPDAYIKDEFRPYCERFCHLLGIESEMALRLLHKTQSAKNLGDLNSFLRDFMLDKPQTFEVAERLINEFGELNEAHKSVVTAREQVENLKPAYERHVILQGLQTEKHVLEELKIGVEPYRHRKYIELLNAYIQQATIQLSGMEGDIESRRKNVSNQIALLRDLEQQHRSQGGSQIEQWNTELCNLEMQRSEHLRKCEQANIACNILQFAFPDSAQNFAKLLATVRLEIDSWQQRQNESRSKQFAIAEEKGTVEKEFRQIVKELQALKRQPSNIPAHMLDLRNQIATAIGVVDEVLPFVGELLEVKSTETMWQGAIERVMHGFALSILVDEQHYTSVSKHINSVNIGSRLVYYRTTQVDLYSAKHLHSQSMAYKLNVKSKCTHAEWLQNELRQRFDYACVSTLKDFRTSERALTCEGQIKHNAARHEKDDRRDINDQRTWVLGFDNRAKLQLFEQNAHTLSLKISDLDQKLQDLAIIEQQRSERVIQCQTLVNLAWQEIDVAPILERIDMITKQLETAKNGNASLQKLTEAITRQSDKVITLEQELKKLDIEYSKLQDKQFERSCELRILQQDGQNYLVSPNQLNGLDERFNALQNKTTLENLDWQVTKVVQALSKEAELIVAKIHECETDIVTCFKEFQRNWPLDASDVDASLASSNDFFAKLQRLETDGLPAYEDRFFELLQNQSHQNLASLSTHLNQARKAILERMALVNTSLSKAPFNPGTYLRIDATDRQLPEVRAFKQEIQAALSHAWDEDREFAEARFVTLRRLVNQLASKDPALIRWRDAVLDVRQHVEFIGRELDHNGNEIEIYRSGAGKSGGQRQKLATTCLAAALRYQLGGEEHETPKYAAVVLDEAFDKADNEFTALAMNVFKNFGFQMIVATPLKSVMTLEPFIGGACFVDINDRKTSGVLLIKYDHKQKKLRLPESA